MADDRLLPKAHLLRRAAFGGSPSEVAAAADAGLAATVDALLGASDSAGPLIPVGQVADFSGKKPVKGLRELQVRWLQRMVTTPAPLVEKMVLFWHGHFAVSYTKVPHLTLMARQNDTFRQMALGKFGDLLLAVSKDPAMLYWLDGNANHKRSPNENYAREVMELFTMGIGNYTEDDVKEAARSFTGWHVKDDDFAYNENDHDHGSKTFLGNSGDFNGDDIVRILAARPETARFIVSKLWRFFAYPGPEQAVVDALAQVYLDSGGDIAQVIRAIFLHDRFYSDQARTGLIRSPADFVVQALRTVNPELADKGAAAAMNQMGQDLFNPPNVAGWAGGLVWINSSTLLARFNFANRLAGSVGRAAEDDVSLAQMQRLLSTSNPSDMLAYWTAQLGNLQLSDVSRKAIQEYAGDPPQTMRQLLAKHKGIVHAVLSSPEYQFS